MKLSLFTTLVSAASIMCLPLADAKNPGKGKGKGGPPTSNPGNPGKGKGKAKGNPGKGKAVKDVQKEAEKQAKKIQKDQEKLAKNLSKEWRKEARFVENERSALVTHWNRYESNDRGLPPGLAKNLRRGKPLPPGWRNKVNDGWVIEDDWWPLFTPVSSVYLPQDFRVPADTGVYLLGDRLVRVHEPTREIIDYVAVPIIVP